MSINLDNKDLAILNQLEHDSRSSITNIARKIGMSKDGVNYRFKRLIDNKIITRFFIDIDVSKLGLSLNKTTIQFKNTTKAKEEEIFNYLKDHPQVGWVVFCSGRWDCVIVTYVKDIYVYEQFLKEFMEKYGQYILSKEFTAHPRYYVCSRKWLDKKPKAKISLIGGKVSNEKIDDRDIQIINMLAKDARVSILDISKKTNLSSSLIIQRIRQLEKKGIILNYRTGLNLSVLGKEFCKSFMHLENCSREEEDRLVKHCLRHPNVTAVTHSIGAWDLELEMEVRNLEEFYEIMNDIKNKFPKIIRNYEAITITKEYGIDYSTMIQ